MRGAGKLDESGEDLLDFFEVLFDCGCCLLCKRGYNGSAKFTPEWHTN